MLCAGVRSFVRLHGERPIDLRLRLQRSCEPSVYNKFLGVLAEYIRTSNKKKTIAQVRSLLGKDKELMKGFMFYATGANERK